MKKNILLAGSLVVNIALIAILVIGINRYDKTMKKIESY